MDKAKDEAINKLIKGQEKMEIDITKMKKDITKMDKDITEMKVDIADLKADQAEMKADQTEMKADIADLKVSQQQFEGLINKVIDGIARIERIVVSIENDLRPKVHTLLDADKIRQDDTAEFRQICREQEKQLDDHELRISNLEKKR
ncbi:MAG: hypothetical protein ACQES4_08715 [Bacillota bacterium]